MYIYTVYIYICVYLYWLGWFPPISMKNSRDMGLGEVISIHTRRGTTNHFIRQILDQHVWRIVFPRYPLVICATTMKNHIWKQGSIIALWCHHHSYIPLIPVISPSDCPWPGLWHSTSLHARDRSTCQRKRMGYAMVYSMVNIHNKSWSPPSNWPIFPFNLEIKEGLSHGSCREVSPISEQNR